ncbi:hypothetical protein Pcinc_034511 [Petrolisthes cinctipes]|uniref:Uncharacterized protein n=1 Tax=Petrolisthes cinctipes TaxID=88211 RepID=A0AAE1EQ48_PETCI|nr:hypothetical protein Pcinc_034511 [Petrolisthes cinctipes]
MRFYPWAFYANLTDNPYTESHYLSHKVQNNPLQCTTWEECATDAFFDNQSCPNDRMGPFCEFETINLVPYTYALREATENGGNEGIISPGIWYTLYILLRWSDWSLRGAFTPADVRLTVTVTSTDIERRACDGVKTNGVNIMYTWNLMFA